MSSPSFYCNDLASHFPNEDINNTTNQKYLSLQYSLYFLLYKYNIFRKKCFDSIIREFISLDIPSILTPDLQSKYSNDIVLFILIASLSYSLMNRNRYSDNYIKDIYNNMSLCYNSECMRIIPDEPFSYEKIDSFFYRVYGFLDGTKMENFYY